MAVLFPFYEVSKTVRWEGAHRLVGFRGTCKCIHGHSFQLKVTVGSDKLDSVGMAMEFAKIKKPLQKMIDDELDHALILNQADPLLKILTADSKNEGAQDVAERIFKVPFNPTSENMARFFWDYVSDHLPHGVELVAIKFIETPSVSVTLKRKDAR